VQRYTAEEMSFLSVLVVTGQAESWAFLGAPLAVTLAQNVFLSVLMNGGPPPGAVEAQEKGLFAAGLCTLNQVYP
jgi:hypothetical protein